MNVKDIKASSEDNLVKNKEAVFAIDNMQEIQVYEVFYGADTLLLILKPFEDGYFKYTSSQTGWRKQNSIHYFVLLTNRLLMHSLEHIFYKLFC